jgi:hypothetical protein
MPPRLSNVLYHFPAAGVVGFAPRVDRAHLLFWPSYLLPRGTKTQICASNDGVGQRGAKQRLAQHAGSDRPHTLPLRGGPLGRGSNDENGRSLAPRLHRLHSLRDDANSVEFKERPCMPMLVVPEAKQRACVSSQSQWRCLLDRRAWDHHPSLRTTVTYRWERSGRQDTRGQATKLWPGNKKAIFLVVGGFLVGLRCLVGKRIHCTAQEWAIPLYG